MAIFLQSACTSRCTSMPPTASMQQLSWLSTEPDVQDMVNGPQHMYLWILTWGHTLDRIQAEGHRKLQVASDSDGAAAPQQPWLGAPCAAPAELHP